MSLSEPTHRDGDLPQNVLGDGQALLDHLLVELVQRGVHQLHADPHIALATHTRRMRSGPRIGKEFERGSPDSPSVRVAQGDPEHFLTAAGNIGAILYPQDGRSSSGLW